MTTSNEDTTRHDALTMGKAGTPSLCRHCFHPRCIQRRHEMSIACVVCESKILPGQQYIVLERVDGEVVMQRHIGCERRRWDR